MGGRGRHGSAQHIGSKILQPANETRNNRLAPFAPTLGHRLQGSGEPTDWQRAEAGVANMFNRIEAYQEAGKRAAQAMNDGDAARFQHESQYARNMWLCEDAGEARQKARAAYDAAYKANRRLPR